MMLYRIICFFLRHDFDLTMPKIRENWRYDFGGKAIKDKAYCKRCHGYRVIYKS
jgi:hypothetical protein